MSESIQKLQNQIVTFLRKRDYKVIRELGQGACGQTVLLADEQIDELFVCKKYVPYVESQRESLFANFLREIKLLHQVHHNNVVRVFNYYVYPDVFAGYILMEFVDGVDLEEAIASNPTLVNEYFLQAVDGFRYLERAGILHRDIRPGNILVDVSGAVKIIDLGFGKRGQTTGDFEKSISLNWWCATPQEFLSGRYDFTTEVYFVGKLFERMIQHNAISSFKYAETLRLMCEYEVQSRIKSFSDVEKRVRANRILEVGFTTNQINVYRAFGTALASRITKIERGARYVEDWDKVYGDLHAVYQRCMLEAMVPNLPEVISCVVDGTYFYNKRQTMETKTLGAFVQLLNSSSNDQRRIILTNLHTKLDSIERYVYDGISDDDIPF